MAEPHDRRAGAAGRRLGVAGRRLGAALRGIAGVALLAGPAVAHGGSAHGGTPHSLLWAGLVLGLMVLSTTVYLRRGAWADRPRRVVAGLLAGGLLVAGTAVALAGP
jgi:hypothetical protein